jgi:hypothetical protein
MRNDLSKTNSKSFRYTSSLEEAAWFLAKSQNQTLVEINLNMIDNEAVFTCDFVGEVVGEELGFVRSVHEKIYNPEAYIKTVTEGLKLLGAQLNGLLKANENISALKTSVYAAAAARFEKKSALKTNQEAAYV